jgi:integrase
LLSNTQSQSVIRWLANIPNPRTRRVYLHALNKFIQYTSKTPDDLIKLGQQNTEDAHDLLKLFYNSLPLASTTRMTMYQAIRSFFRTNRILLSTKPRTFRAIIEYEPTRLYTQEEVACLVDTASTMRNKALIMFLAQSGQRVGIVVSLRLRHINFNQSPPIVVDIPAVFPNHQGLNVNKSRTPYQFAIGQDAVTYLNLMIHERYQRSEPLNHDSWLFRSTSRRFRQHVIRKVQRSTPGSSLSPSQVDNIVRRVAVKRGIQQQYGKRYLFHPHGFRRYWKHQLRMGGVNPVLLDYMIGHTLPYHGAYDRWTIQDIRNQYKRAEKFVNPQTRHSVTKEEIQTEILNIFLDKICHEDLVTISTNPGVSVAHIQQMLKGFHNNKDIKTN